MALRTQRPAEGYDWLYQDRGENDRYFTDMVILGKHEPEWAQCTQEEREQWEHDHQPEQPEEIQEDEEGGEV
jgi:hypothetical protein